MDDEEPVVMSVRDRIARLQRGNAEVPSREHGSPLASPVHSARPPPPPVPAASKPIPTPRPYLPARNPSVSSPTNELPPSRSNSTTSNEAAAVRPTSYGMDGISRPALPPRTSTSSSTQSLFTPGIPQRRASALSPDLPPRRPSDTFSQLDMQISRRPSNESLSSIGTEFSSVSGFSNSTTTTTASQRTQKIVRAPSFDPTMLPPLPPKRTEDERDAYYRSGSKQFSRMPLKGAKTSSSAMTRK